jgi:hypothetical protein
MITKTSFWKTIKKGLIEVERSKKITNKVMKIIKDVPQSENKVRET